MASPPSQSQNDVRVTVSSLLSPPETKRQDSFSTSMASSHVRTPLSSFSSDNGRLTAYIPQTVERDGRDTLPPSPPISPYTNNANDSVQCSPASISLKDPQLFSEPGSLPSHVPLFPESHIDAAIKQHISQSPEPAVKPTHQEYKQFLEFTTKVGEGFNRNPRAWVEREVSFQKHYAAKSRSAAGEKTQSYLVSGPLRNIAPAPVGHKRQRVSPQLARVPRAARVQKTTPKTPIHQTFDDVYGTPSTKAVRQPTNRDDIDYQSLEDFSPPVSTLPKNNNKVLKADWKGQMLDLSADPDRHMLHEAEVTLAATLRLSCATYLCSKRRIFQARVGALRIGKEFRKTDAQQACKIDVNKASKLWSAYDKVGWFNPDFFQRFV
ncbi:hypothetical protein K402DRAFT_415088 [Aulographum hederae CBS 113979]|uniref:SWIRM domain-containing protein n=1 Tax=Aulographum hederae CBS 113979 TaxID=1176131 RepID=A0A6G1GN41_9PEZI|nr:hypothetical protein K402DRAFT_415088 [Aulographum hederae CBS 113979]